MLCIGTCPHLQTMLVHGFVSLQQSGCIHCHSGSSWPSPGEVDCWCPFSLSLHHVMPQEDGEGRESLPSSHVENMEEKEGLKHWLDK